MRELTNIERENVQGVSIDAPPLKTIQVRRADGEWETIVVGWIILGF